MKKIAITVAALAATVALAGPAAAENFGPSRIYTYVHDTTSLTPYGITLNTGPTVWVRGDTYFVNCTSASVSDGSLISMTNLGRVRAAQKSVRITTSFTARTYIACL